MRQVHSAMTKRERDHRNSGCGGKCRSRQPNKGLPGPLDERPMGKPVTIAEGYVPVGNTMEMKGSKDGSRSYVVTFGGSQTNYTNVRFLQI